MLKIGSKIAIFLVLGITFNPVLAFAQADFNPHFIISDQELQDAASWTRDDIQKFLDAKGSYLRSYSSPDVSGTVKNAADIIYDASQTHRINPKYLLVTLQKEQSLITDDSPTQRQLDWATGYAVCDGCYLTDPKVTKYKGFGKQVDGAAGIMRWYYDNISNPIVKKKDTPIRIDSEEVTPGSWATAFLYTYTPHLHGNRNFWRVWETWFEQNYPNGTLLKFATSSEYWLIQDGQRRRFKTKTALITRVDPQTAITVGAVDLANYPVGLEISFPNYSILRSASTTYLLDYDTIRPFASDEVVRKLGYNPQEVLDVEEAELASYPIGLSITTSSTAPQGLIYQITDLKNALYLLKDGVLYPIPDKQIVANNFKFLSTEKHKLKDLKQFTLADQPLGFRDGTLLQAIDSGVIYVIDKGKKRRIADDDTFVALGYKRSNITTVDTLTVLSIPSGETLFINASLVSSKNKFLGDSAAPVADLFSTKLPAYLVAEYPTGRIISGKNIDSRRSIASLAKMMVAAEALNENFKLTGSTAYNNTKHAAEGNSLGLVTGEKIANKDLFYSMLIGSVNPVARMVAQSTGLSESELVKRANKHLEEWGADNTTLADVTGLDERNKSTARDLLKIFTKILANKTIKDALSRTNYSFRELVNKNKQSFHSFKNTNQLLERPNRNYRILASKTGYTDEAGAVLIMLIESRKTKKQYVVITMGNGDYKKRFDEPNNIASWIAKGDVKIASSQ